MDIHHLPSVIISTIALCSHPRDVLALSETSRAIHAALRSDSSLWGAMLARDFPDELEPSLAPAECVAVSTRRLGMGLRGSCARRSILTHPSVRPSLNNP